MGPDGTACALSDHHAGSLSSHQAGLYDSRREGDQADLSAYVPPPKKRRKKVERTRFRERHEATGKSVAGRACRRKRAGAEPVRLMQKKGKRARKLIRPR